MASNRLIDEKSPYLLQHAHNPVHWYPWGPEAFETARREDKPIFLSIGYSTCHWCHVMERESFSNPDIAAIMNAHYVCIKVDREERPDVDKIYMTAVQAIAGRGGWPLSAWLTPDLKPFFGGTYFPPEPRWGQQSFPEILERIAEMWKNEREKLVESGAHVGAFLAESLTKGEGPAEDPDPSLFEEARAGLEDQFDAENGGFGGAPKFPMPVYYHFLLRDHARTKNPESLEMAVASLHAMARGGLRDHVGGGFHRYSTDARWHVPHFEKMLYDNAQLAAVYVEAYQLTRDPAFAEVARETLDYVLRDLTHPEGAFYSAEDADSLLPDAKDSQDLRAEPRAPAASPGGESHAMKGEGAFYVWTKNEIDEVLGPDAAPLFAERYGVQPNGNAAADPLGEFKGKNILFEARAIKDLAAARGLPEKDAVWTLREARRKLFDRRAARPRPHLDDKIIAGWNGLMISALAKAAQAFEEPRYLLAAEKAALFLHTRLYDAQARRLYRRWRDGERKIPGIADDYAFVVQGLLDLHEASFDLQWLDWAVTLAEEQDALFLDKDAGGYFLTAADHDENLIARVKEDMDNVEPSASSVAVLNVLRLELLTGREDFRRAAEMTLRFFTPTLRARALALPQMLSALAFALGQPRQIVLAGAPGAADTKALLRAVNRLFLPFKTLLLADGGPGVAREILHGKAPRNGHAAAYVCVDKTCAPPVDTPEALAKLLA